MFTQAYLFRSRNAEFSAAFHEISRRWERANAGRSVKSHGFQKLASRWALRAASEDERRRSQERWKQSVAALRRCFGSRRDVLMNQD